MYSLLSLLPKCSFDTKHVLFNGFGFDFMCLSLTHQPRFIAYKRRPRRPPFLRVLSVGMGVTSSKERTPRKPTKEKSERKRDEWMKRDRCGQSSCRCGQERARRIELQGRESWCGCRLGRKNEKKTRTQIINRNGLFFCGFFGVIFGHSLERVSKSVSCQCFENRWREGGCEGRWFHAPRTTDCHKGQRKSFAFQRGEFFVLFWPCTY